MKDFRKLKVWEKGHRLTLAIYKATTTFPKEELYGLTSQMRRSCASRETTEVKRMLTSFIQKLKADR